MATHIKDILDGFIESKKEALEIAYKVSDIVKRNLSKEMSENVCFTGIEQGYFLFFSPSSSFSYEFSLQREKLLNELKKEFRDIQGIKLQVRT